MSNFFDVYGPFSIVTTEREIKHSQRNLWKKVSDWGELDQAIGCYMFCLEKGTDIVPWYVGKTWALGGFKSETFTPHKVKMYNSCLEGKTLKPSLFLFPLMTGDGVEPGRFSTNRTTSKRVIGWLEKILMSVALQRNASLGNMRDLTFPRSVTVRGIIGSRKAGRPYQEVVRARDALFGRS